MSRARRSAPPAPEARGLPSDQALLDLADTYLQFQAASWPERVRPAPDSARELADGFRARFLAADATAADDHPSGVELGAVYLRYSCDHSNPRSLAQQLRNAFDRANRDRVFVPWVWVFADAAVTGTVAARRGYQLAKAAVRRPAGGPAGRRCCTSTSWAGPAGTRSSRCGWASWWRRRASGWSGPPTASTRPSRSPK